MMVKQKTGEKQATMWISFHKTFLHLFSLFLSLFDTKNNWVFIENSSFYVSKVANNQFDKDKESFCLKG